GISRCRGPCVVQELGSKPDPCVCSGESLGRADGTPGEGFCCTFLRVRDLGTDEKATQRSRHGFFVKLVTATGPIAVRYIAPARIGLPLSRPMILRDPSAPDRLLESVSQPSHPHVRHIHP